MGNVFNLWHATCIDVKIKTDTFFRGFAGVRESFSGGLPQLEAKHTARE